MSKIINILLLSFYLFLNLASPTLGLSSSPLPQVFIINQVRGDSCCQKGSLEFLKQQITLHQTLKIPAFFTLRYDALTNPEYLKLFKQTQITSPDLIKLGLLIEIIPSLAQDAHLTYQADESNWQEAQHAFTIGYTNQERKQVIDYLTNYFYQQFNFYPQLTSSWMIDTFSLNYLHSQYQVKAHLITREQMGTDTYHLYGAPPHYPYPASQSWLMIPDYQNSSSPLILRQTVTDPLHNYGDTTNSFTSQPNDYLNGQKDFSYFKNLIDQALFNQSTTLGFALLGLENSMPSQYQKEYQHQLGYINTLSQNHQITYPSLTETINTWKQIPLTLYQGQDLVNPTDNQAFWITTPQYRLRLRLSNHQVFITDIRLYHPSLIDPYTNYQALKEGYWLTPYLIDASLNQKPEKSSRSFWLKLFGPPPPSPSLTKPHQDLIPSQVTHLSLPALKQSGQFTWTKQTNSLTLTYPTNNNQTLTIKFTPDQITLSPLNLNNLTYQDFNTPQNPIKYQKKDYLSLSWNLDQQLSHNLIVNCQSDQCHINFSQNPTLFDQIRQTHYPFLFPERQPRPINENNTVLYIHNRYAVANRNPVRIILIPKDKYNLPITPQEQITIETNPQISISNQADQFAQIIDLNSTNPQSVNLKIKVNNHLLKSDQIFFSPNCKQNLKYCLGHPRQAFWYIKTITYDKIRLKLFKEKQ